jgi:hypothetical protein
MVYRSIANTAQRQKQGSNMSDRRSTCPSLRGRGDCGSVSEPAEGECFFCASDWTEARRQAEGSNAVIGRLKVAASSYACLPACPNC